MVTQLYQRLKMGNGALLALNRDNEMHATLMSDDMDREWQDNETQFDDHIYEEEEIAKEILLKGAVGKFACHINNSFIETNRMHNEHVLYKSSSNHWLRFAFDGRWMVSNTNDKEENLLGGFCYCKKTGLPDPSYAKGWFVLGEQGIFRTQTQLKATKTSDTSENEKVPRSPKDECQEEQEQQRAQKELEKYKINTKIEVQRIEEETTKNKIPVAIKVQGATGLLAGEINGIYKRRECAKFFFQSHSHTTVFYDSSGRWIVHNGQRALAYCGVTGLSNPCKATRWYITNSSNCFSVQPSMSVTSVDTKINEPKSRSRPSFTSDLMSLSSLTTPMARISRTRLSYSSGMLEDTFAPVICPRRRKSLPSRDETKNEPTEYMKAVARMQSTFRKQSSDSFPALR